MGLLGLVTSLAMKKNRSIRIRHAPQQTLFDILVKNYDNRNVINEIVVAISRDTSHVKQPNESSTQCSNPALRTKNKFSGVGGVAKPSL